MQLNVFDVMFFISFFAVVLGVSMYKSRKERSGEDFFLASRGLIWPLIGFSLIAANISSEHFVGMAGQGAGIAGLAVASYEWIGAISLVIVALFFLPKFLKSGIYTIPEFLEYRYNSASRSLMAFYTMIVYVGVTVAAVIYSGALALNTIFNVPLSIGVWLIGGIAALYTVWGGLKAVAWADLFQGSALILGGAITMILGFIAVGGIGPFMEVNQAKLHVVLPSNHPVLPWTVLLVGLWIPNFYYWGLNQFIVQRALAAKSMTHGQRGIIFAAALKLIMPFIIVFPGIMALQLYGADLTGPGKSSDAAYPLLIKNLVTPGIRGFIFAAITGAVISTLASVLNSASTIFTMDLYKKFSKKETSGPTMIKIGRITTGIFVVIGCVIAPQLANPEFQGIFNYIQEFQGFLSPGVLAAFLFGLFVKRAPAAVGVVSLVLCPIIYGVLLIGFGHIAFLNRMAITFIAIIVVMAVMTALKPLAQPKTLPVLEGMDLKVAPSTKWLGLAVVVVALAMYAIFW